MEKNRLRLLDDFFEELPYQLKEYIYSYVSTVKNASYEIFKEAKIDFESELLNKLLIVAGMKKLKSIIDSNFWLVNNSSELMYRNRIDRIKIGQTNLLGVYYSKLWQIKEDFDEIIESNGFGYILTIRRYDEILKELVK